MPGVLLHRLARTHRGGIRSALQQLQRRAFESNKVRGIDGVRKVGAHRPDRCFVTDPETGGMYRVIEILEVFLVEPERKIGKAAVNIAHIMKHHALQVFAQQRKPQLHIIDEKRVAAERKSRGWRRSASGNQRSSDVARSGLVVPESAQRIGSAAEEPLRQWNGFLRGNPGWRRKRLNDSELSLARQH